MKRAQTTSLACLLLAAWLTSCEKPTSDRLQGYVEGEFVYPSPPIAGKLKRLAVKRGDQVQAGDVLFEIDATQQKAACDEALQRVQQAQANLADAKKGKRPSEIQSLQAQLSQLQAATALSAKELSRQEDLRTSGAVPQESLDRARSLNEQNRFRIAQIEAEIATANLGARADLITAAEAEVTARQAALAKAKWGLRTNRPNRARSRRDCRHVVQ
jgi:HlyD family secretion protein